MDEAVRSHGMEGMNVNSRHDPSNEPTPSNQVAHHSSETHQISCLIPRVAHGRRQCQEALRVQQSLRTGSTLRPAHSKSDATPG